MPEKIQTKAVVGHYNKHKRLEKFTDNLVFRFSLPLTTFKGLDAMVNKVRAFNGTGCYYAHVARALQGILLDDVSLDDLVLLLNPDKAKK
jgi:hypothetical protein